VGGPGGGSLAGPGGPLAGPGPAAAILLEAERALDPRLTRARTGGVSPEAVQAAILSLNGCLSAITPLERSVLTLRYGLDGGAFRSPSAVGRALGTSRRGAMRLEQQALRNLRIAATSTNCGVVASASGLPAAFDPTTIAALAANPFGATPSDGGSALAGGGPARVAVAAPLWTGASHRDIGWLLLAIAVLGGLLVGGGVLANGYQRSAPPRPAPRTARRGAQRRPGPAAARQAASHGRRRAGSRRQSVRFRRHGKAPEDD
jgi:hypothetical protein